MRGEREPLPPLPVAIIGAGPVGLAAAAHLVARGEAPLVLEAGDSVAASVREWVHVRLFSPWEYLVDPVAKRLLESADWRAPDGEQIPTGGDLVRHLLDPLANLPQIAPHIRLGHRVLTVTRRGLDKVKTGGREGAPFELVVRTSNGTTKRLLARAVIDAAGTWLHPNPLGAGGVPADGEIEHRDRIRYGIPDVRGSDRTRYAGVRTLVVGSGHSAFNTLLDLADLANETQDTEIVWAIRRTDVGLLFGGGSRDALPARGALGRRLQALVTSGRVNLVTGFRAERIVARGGRVVVESDAGELAGPVDQIVVATGFRPDLSMTRELRLELDPWLEAPRQLAPLIDPNLHSCGTVYPHGAAELRHPERDYYVVGMKSYGRAPTFLLLTGYEQVRSVVCALTGDEAGARNVQLVLPETGVCQTDLAGPACCSTSDSSQGSHNVPVAIQPAASCGCGCDGNCDEFCDGDCRRQNTRDPGRSLT
ncbi:MAG: FAD-dependent oxidoreductase [Gemmatimonadaceae bacterium]